MTDVGDVLHAFVGLMVIVMRIRPSAHTVWNSTVLNCTEDYGRRLLPLCPHLCIFSHLNRLILTTLINSCQTSGFSKVGAIIKCNIMHFPVLIKTLFKLVYIICLQELHYPKE